MSKLLEIVDKISILEKTLIKQDIEKAWVKKPIGTEVTRKDGKKYRKIAETGNEKADWIEVKDKVTDPKVKENNDKQPKTDEEGKPSLSKKELTEHAKNTSEDALNNAIKQSSDPNIRQSAHEELDRRSKEEHIQEDKQPLDKKSKTDTSSDKKEDGVSNKKDIKSLVDQLNNKYKSTTNELMNFSDYNNSDKLKELQIKQKDISRFIQHLESIRETDINKNSELLKNKLNFKGDIKDLFGDGDILHLSVNSQSEGTKVIAVFEDGFTERFFDENKDSVKMNHFYLNPLIGMGKGKGTDIFKNQVGQFRKLGFKNLKTIAGDIGGMNGYYTWARLGYEFSSDSEKNALLDMIDFEDDKDIKKSSTLQEIMSTEKGRKWWKENGFSFNGVFNLDDNSESMKILNNYKK